MFFLYRVFGIYYESRFVFLSFIEEIWGGKWGVLEGWKRFDRFLEIILVVIFIFISFFWRGVCLVMVFGCFNFIVRVVGGAFLVEVVSFCFKL